MSETRSVRVPEELHSRLKELSEEEDKSLSEVAESYLVIDNEDGSLSLSEAESLAQDQVLRVLQHVVLGECEDPKHEKIREKLGVRSREKAERARKQSVVGYCPRCGAKFTGEDVIEPVYGDEVYVEHQCPEDSPADIHNHDRIDELDERPPSVEKDKSGA